MNILVPNSNDDDSSQTSGWSEVNSGPPVGPANVDANVSLASSPAAKLNDDTTTSPKRQKTGDEDAASVSSWSVVSSSPAVAAVASASAPDDASVASSTISGFDLISLGGSSQKQCHLCTFLNKTGATHCGMCEANLGNPCTGSDESLARFLQKQEGEDAFGEVPAQVLDRAQKLARDILSVIEDCPLGPTNRQHLVLSAPSVDQLTLLVSQFLDCLQSSSGQMVKLCYCITRSRPGVTHDINQDGFRPKVSFGSTPEAAVLAYRNVDLGRGRRGFGSDVVHLRRPRFLTYIQEDNTISPSNTVGWLAAVVCGGPVSRRDSEVRVTSGWAWIYRRFNTVQSLPLVSFPADMMEADVIRRLLNGLTKTFNDSPSFWSHEVETSGITEDMASHKMSWYPPRAVRGAAALSAE